MVNWILFNYVGIFNMLKISGISVGFDGVFGVVNNIWLSVLWFGGDIVCVMGNGDVIDVWNILGCWIDFL